MRKLSCLTLEWPTVGVFLTLDDFLPLRSDPHNMASSGLIVRYCMLRSSSTQPMRTPDALKKMCPHNHVSQPPSITADLQNLLLTRDALLPYIVDIGLKAQVPSSVRSW